MIKAILTGEMKKSLRELIGKNFVSYECGKTFNTAYGNLRINTSGVSIEITNLEKEMPFFDGTEEVAVLQCEKIGSNKPFQPYCIEPFQIYEVGEIIKSIEIIKDKINVNNGEYEIAFDRAIVIRMEKGILMFSRGIWFSEEIAISENDQYDTLFPIEEVVDAWSNEGEYMVRVERFIETL